LARGSEHVVADLMDGVVELAQRIGDALAGHLAGQVSRGLQAEPDLEQAADDPVEQLLVAVCVLGDGGAGPGPRGPRAAGPRWRPG
jgi:hypothetical protein